MDTKPKTARAEREGLRIWLIVLLVAVVGFAVTWQFVGPSVPDSIVLATGGEGGAYHAFGKRYREAFAPYGIDVVLRTTAGSTENVQLLAQGEVDLAFVQGGTVPEADRPLLEGIASLYYEPLWIFLRADVEVSQLTDLVGRRVQIGAQGSGTRVVALELLAANGVSAANSAFSELPTDEAVERLLSGGLDALCLVAGPDSSAVKRLMQHAGAELRLFDVPRGLAYERLFRHLREVVLAEGVLDPAQDVPDHDIHLMAATAGLLATPALHEALAPLLIDSARAIHGQGGVFEATGEFPAEGPLDVPLSVSARHYFQKGPSFLYRVLPFGAAATIDRLTILLLPLLTLLLPLLKVAPPLYRWRIRSKIYRWYRVLNQVEHDVDLADADADRAPMIARLNAVEREIHGVRVPPSYMEELYNLRMHLARVLTELRAAPGSGA